MIILDLLFQSVISALLVLTAAGYLGSLMIPIDHCLVSEDIRVINASTAEGIGSDHLPLIVELELPSHSRALAALIRP
jgi:endonuclease/exonuclease/phosphatase (EEP) superfamily protein YafD